LAGGLVGSADAAGRVAAGRVGTLHHYDVFRTFAEEVRAAAARGLRGAPFRLGINVVLVSVVDLQEPGAVGLQEDGPQVLARFFAVGEERAGALVLRLTLVPLDAHAIAVAARHDRRDGGGLAAGDPGGAPPEILAAPRLDRALEVVSELLQ
jgi:hypothetical protein